MAVNLIAPNLIAPKVHEHHLIVMHEVTNTGSDRSQLAKIASQAKDILGADWRRRCGPSRQLYL